MEIEDFDPNRYCLVLQYDIIHWKKGIHLSTKGKIYKIIMNYNCKFYRLW